MPAREERENTDGFKTEEQSVCGETRGQVLNIFNWKNNNSVTMKTAVGASIVAVVWLPW